MRKYTVHNCPANNTFWGCRGDKKLKRHCKDIPNCLLKQIVKLCNDVLEQETDPLNSFEMSFAQKILQLLEIEEVDENRRRN